MNIYNMEKNFVQTLYVYVYIKIFQIITLPENALYFYAFRNKIEKSTFCQMLFELNMWYNQKYLDFIIC